MAISITPPAMPPIADVMDVRKAAAMRISSGRIEASSTAYLAG